MTTRLITSRIPLTQRGLATLSTALILLIAITLMTFSSAKVGIMEQKIAANDYRAKQALHAAQAGLDRAVYESNVGVGVGAAPNGTFTAVTTLAAVGTGPSTSYQYAYSVPAGAPAGLPTIIVTAKGYSDDSVATKTLTQYIKKYSPLPSVPNNPLSTGGSYDSNSNSISIVNNISGGVGIQAQGTIDTGGKNITSVNGVAGVGLVPNATIPGVTGLVDTTAERNAFFENAFGTTKADIQSMSLPVSCGGNCNALLQNSTPPSGSTFGTPPAPIIWVTGDTILNSKTVIGSPTNPVILIINGTLDMSGSATIYGVVYVTGGGTDSVVGDSTDVAGNVTVQGSIVSEESFRFRGTVNVTYDKFNAGGGPLGPDFYVKAPGTWKDCFNITCT